MSFFIGHLTISEDLDESCSLVNVTSEASILARLEIAGFGRRTVLIDISSTSGTKNG